MMQRNAGPHGGSGAGGGTNGLRRIGALLCMERVPEGWANIRKNEINLPAPKLRAQSEEARAD